MNKLNKKLMTGNDDLINKKFIFITGVPRSGTSLITKVIDSHPDVAILMENIMGNRRRHWTRAQFWENDKELSMALIDLYKNLNEPVIGNKVIIQDVWSAEDVHRVCSSFQDSRIIYVVRNPLSNALSRAEREKKGHYNEVARKNLLIYFGSKFETFLSSWFNSLLEFYRLKDTYRDKLYLIYYDDFILNFETQVQKLFSFLDIRFNNQILEWYNIPHHDNVGNSVIDLKYKDRNIYSDPRNNIDLPKELLDATKQYNFWIDLWKNRKLETLLNIG